MKKTNKKTTSQSHTDDCDNGFNGYLEVMTKLFAEATDDGQVNVFTTDVSGLFDLYLDNLPKKNRKYHTCSACRHFIEHFGGLVSIDADGRTRPVMWDIGHAPAYYAPAIMAMHKAVSRAAVTGVFISKDKTLGTPKTGEWTHFNVIRPTRSVFSSRLETAGQAMAEKREDFKNVMTALVEFPLNVIEQALKILGTEHLYRSDKFLAPCQWLHTLSSSRRDAKGATAKNNVVWLAVGNAPSGFCHPRSSMIGTLLEDIASGMTFETVKARFDAKMHPLQYQRPQEAPDAGNIKQAEQIVEKLGIKDSLRRRYARVEELTSIWTPTLNTKTAETSSVFGHLKAKSKANTISDMVLPAVTMTFEKFRDTVMPHALEIEVDTTWRNNYGAFVTAADPSAPPIIRWDNPDKRCPFNHYVYHGGSLFTHWHTQSDWTKVNAVVLHPCAWSGAESHNDQFVCFILDGMRESKDNIGLALFPEVLRGELHSVRSTIEAFSKNGSIEDRQDGSACGLFLMKGIAWKCRLTVRTATGKQGYILDRWN